MRAVATALLAGVASALLPPPLDTACVPQALLGCYIDAANRTFPVTASTQPGDPFNGNMTLETCGYLCGQRGYSIGGAEVGDQCFCTPTLSNLTAYIRPMSECDQPCVGNTFENCGGAWRILAFNFTCSPYSPAGAAWLDTSAPVETRVDDLLARLASSPDTSFSAMLARSEPEAMAGDEHMVAAARAAAEAAASGATLPSAVLAQLVQNGADVYSPTVQLPRYIVSQECLAGYQIGQIYIAPTVPDAPSSSGFPQPVNMGHTMDTELIREIASAIGDEARAGWVHYNRPSLTCMSPNLNVARAPQWGRSCESFGEDPQLIAALGTAYVKGIQEGTPGQAAALASASADGSTAATSSPSSVGLSSTQWKTFAMPKHIGAYSVEGCLGNQSYPNCDVYRSFFNSIVDDVDMREGYLPGWESTILSGGASGVMCSYNALNGVPMCGNGAVLNTILRGEYNMSGPVISDADAVRQIWAPNDTPHGHNYTAGGASWLGAAVSAMVNGTSISLEEDPSTFDPANNPNLSTYHNQLNAALAAGLVGQQQVLAAARQALLPRFLVGMYDPPSSVPWNNVPASTLESPAHHALARRAAADSIVLLQNNASFLPLKPPSAGGPKHIAVVGPGANCSYCIVYRYSGSPLTVVTPWSGIQAAITAAGGSAVFGGESGAAAVAAVAAADLGIVILTSNPEGESKDREHIGLPDDQLAFLSQLAATGTPLVVGTVSGGTVDISPALPVAKAVLALHQGGMEAGSGLADVLWGAVNPSAALAVTVYRTSWEGASDFLSMSLSSSPGRGHRWLTDEAAADRVLYPFAYGLSYSSWDNAVTALAPATVSAGALAGGANISVSVSVTNTGAVSGSRAVLLFLARQGAGPDQGWPRQWLAQQGMAKVHGIGPAGSTTLSFTLVGRDFARWVPAPSGATLEGSWVIQPGVYSLLLRDDAKGGAPGQPQQGYSVTVTA